MPLLTGDTCYLERQLIQTGLAMLVYYRCLNYGCQQCFEPWVSVVSLLIGGIHAVTHGWHCYLVLQFIPRGLGEVLVVSLPSPWVPAVCSAMGIRRVITHRLHSCRKSWMALVT